MFGKLFLIFSIQTIFSGRHLVILKDALMFFFIKNLIILKEGEAMIAQSIMRI